MNKYPMCLCFKDFEEGKPANQLLISMLKEAQFNECLTAEEEKIVNGIYR